MKHILITTIATVLLVGCGNPQPQEILTHEAVSNANIEDTKQHLAVGTDVIAQKEPLEYEAEGSLVGGGGSHWKRVYCEAWAVPRR